MKRRDVLAAAGALAAGACAREPSSAGASAPAGRERFEWKMVTTWPPNFPGVGTGAAALARSLEIASGGRLKIRVFAAGELVPALEVFDTVQRGTAEMGHGAAYYWRNKFEAAQFFTTIPFGMNVLELNGWLYDGGGLDLYRELYAPANLVPFPAGNTGVQMAGWFKKEIRSIADLKGLKMRIPGIGGEAFGRAGGTPVTLPASEVFTALQTGSIDAAEWIGPYNDVALGLNQAASYYYYPGWHEPGPALELIVNREAFEGLPPDLQELIGLACSATNDRMTAEFVARNAQSLKQLREEGEVKILRLPDDVLETLRRHTDEILSELVAEDATVARIHASFAEYRRTVVPWTKISEQAFFETRGA